MMELRHSAASLLLPTSSSTLLATALPSHLPLNAISSITPLTKPQLPGITLRSNSSISVNPASDSASPAVGRHGACKQLASRKKLRAIRAPKSAGSADAPDSSSSASTSSERGSQTQSHLELLERLTQNSASASTGKEVKTIREQLSSQIEPEEQEVIIPLSNLEKEVPVLTISQKRNIRRQDYLNKVSERNDVPFFTTVAAFVLVPPICILGIAVAVGYVDLFP